jgi:hypothetical protein
MQNGRTCPDGVILGLVPEIGRGGVPVLIPGTRPGISGTWLTGFETGDAVQ